MNNAFASEFTVIHLSSGHIGGAGLAARRLNSKLNQSGIDSKFMALEQANFIPEVDEYIIKRNMIEKIVSKVLTKINLMNSRDVFFSLYSQDVLFRKMSKIIDRPKTTILHIHNSYNLITTKNIITLSSMGIPIVVTLHDQRFMTGGCHYALDCDGFVKDCLKCPKSVPIFRNIPNKNLIKLKELMQSKDNKLSFVAPSEWILNEAKKSTLLKLHNVSRISNTLNIPMKKTRLTKMDRTLNSKLCIGIANMDKNSYVKGGDLIRDMEAILIKRKSRVNLIHLSDWLAIGKPAEEFWETIDSLLIPSRADNSPNVIHEAKYFGVPVIATKVGGISEMLNKDFDIEIDIANLTPESLADIIEQTSSYFPEESEIAEMQKKFLVYLGDPILQITNLYKSLIC